MTIKELIPLLEAMDRGETVERFTESGVWVHVCGLYDLLNSAYCDCALRIKPAPKYFVPKVGARYYHLEISTTEGVRIVQSTRTAANDNCYTYTSSTEQKAQVCADELQKVLDKHREIVG